MATGKQKDLPRLDSVESDAVFFEDSPTNTLQREISQSPTTTKDSKTLGQKIRQSFIFGKYEKVKKELRETRALNEELKSENDELRQENFQLRTGMAAILDSNPFHVKNLQVGNNCTINSLEFGAEATLEELDDLVAKLTDAVSKIFDERTRLVQELENNKVLLAEIQETLADYSKKCEQKIKMDTKSFGELKAMLMDLQSDRSDSLVLAECMAGLQEYVKNRIVVDYDQLPPHVQAGITRLVNKFGDVPWHEFATRLGLEPERVDYHSRATGRKSESDDVALTKDGCAKILAEWAKEPQHTASLLLDHLQNIDRERTELAKKRFTISMIKEKKRSGRSDLRNTPSVTSRQSQSSVESAMSSHRATMRQYASKQLGEQRTQTAHAVELCRTVLEKLEPLAQMKMKLDALYDAHEVSHLARLAKDEEHGVFPEKQEKIEKFM